MRYHEPRQRDGGFDFIKRKATSHPAKHTEQNMVYEQREILKEKQRERESYLFACTHYTLHTMLLMHGNVSESPALVAWFNLKLWILNNFLVRFIHSVCKWMLPFSRRYLHTLYVWDRCRMRASEWVSVMSAQFIVSVNCTSNRHTSWMIENESLIGDITNRNLFCRKVFDATSSAFQSVHIYFDHTNAGAVAAADMYSQSWVAK